MVKEPEMACFQHAVLNFIQLNLPLYTICFLVELTQELRRKFPIFGSITDQITEAMSTCQNVLQPCLSCNCWSFESICCKTLSNYLDLYCCEVVGEVPVFPFCCSLLSNVRMTKHNHFLIRDEFFLLCLAMTAASLYAFSLLYLPPQQTVVSFYDSACSVLPSLPNETF